MLDDSRPPLYRWFAGAKVNTCHNALDRHVEADAGERTTPIRDSPATGNVRRYGYRERRDTAALFARPR